MVATMKPKIKVSAFTLLMLFTQIIPIVLEFLGQGEPNARIDLTFDHTSSRLKAKVSTSDQEGTVSKSIAQNKQ